MAKEMLDILVDQKKVEEIAVLPTSEDVEKKLKEEGVNATSEDVKVLKNVFEAAANKLDESELEKIGGGIDWKSAKAKKAYKIVGGVIAATVGVTGGAYLVDKYKFGGRGMGAIKDAAGKIFNNGNHQNPQP